MTTAAQLHKTAFGLPDTAAKTTTSAGAAATAFTVAGRTFAVLATGGVVELRLDAEPLVEALAQLDGSERLPGGSRGRGLSIALADLDGQALNYWVRRAWMSHAPAQLAASEAAAAAAGPGSVGDLPASIGTPATRALAGAGLTSLQAVAAVDDATLLALHGVGATALRRLRAAIDEQAIGT